MKRTLVIGGTVVSTVFVAMAAIALAAAPAAADACSGNGKVCPGTCSATCSPSDPNDCWVACRLTKADEE